MSEQDRFQDTSSGVIRDTQFHLEWLPKDSYGDLGKWVNWREAAAYAALMNQVYAGGNSDWRFPTREEVLHLYNEELNQKDWEDIPVHIHPLFVVGCANLLWTSEKNEAGQALRIDLRDGELEFLDLQEREPLAIRLVRNTGK